VQLDWSKDGVIGNSTPVSRTEGAENLLDLVNNYTFLPGEQLNVVDHSHGGNVTKEFTQLYSGDKKIDNLVLLGTPQRSDYKLDTNDLAPNAKVINVYDKNDVIQVLGGQTPVSGGRRMENAYNIPVFQYKNQTINTDNDSRKLGFPSQVVVPLSIGPVKSHTELDSKPVWDKAVVPLLRKPTLPSNYRQPELKPIPIEVK